MNILKKLLSKIIYGVATIIDSTLEFTINLIEKIVSIVRGLFKGIFLLLAMGGCLFFIFFAHIGLMLLLNPVGFLTAITLILLPTLGARFAAYLKYLRYITTNYLYNTANHYKDGAKYKYVPFDEYKAAYRRAQEEKRRREQEFYYQQQQEWFRQWQQQSFHGAHGGYQNGNQRGHYGNGYSNPQFDFKGKYEKSCQILGVKNTADKKEIKLAYRKKAKEYHPDVNKSPEATKVFQMISEAYNFLNDENIQRYNSLKGT